MAPTVARLERTRRLRWEVFAAREADARVGAGVAAAAILDVGALRLAERPARGPDDSERFGVARRGAVAAKSLGRAAFASRSRNSRRVRAGASAEAAADAEAPASATVGDAAVENWAARPVKGSASGAVWAVVLGVSAGVCRPRRESKLRTTYRTSNAVGGVVEHVLVQHPRNDKPKLLKK